MTRRQAAANARRVLESRKRDRVALQNEIKSLRDQIGTEIGRQYGASGLNVSLGTISEEYVPELSTHTARAAVYERMSNDPIVRGQLRAIYSTIASSVRWRVVGGTPEMQDLVAANILRDGPRRLWCSTSWPDRVYEMLGMLPYGFSSFIKTRGQAVDGTYFFEHLKWMHPRAIRDSLGWPMDENDNLIAVRRQLTDATGKTIFDEVPARNVFLVPWDRRGPNWEGNAFIRPMYKPWKFMELAEKIDMIDLQNRGVAIPVAKLSGGGGTKERDTLTAILKSLRGGSKERAFIVLEKDEAVEFLTSTGTSKDAGPILDHHRSGVVKSAGTEYLESGNTASGSRAASSAMAAGFFIEVDSIVRHLEDIVNNGAGPQLGLVEELHVMNGWEDEDEFARIEASRVSPTEQLDNIPLVLESVQKGAVPRSMKLSNWITDRLGAPTLTDAEYRESVGGRSVVDTGTPSGQPEADPNAPPAPPVGPAAGGRPADAPNSTAVPDPRKDTASRRLGLQAEKKSPDATPPKRRSAYSPWLESTPS